MKSISAKKAVAMNQPFFTPQLKKHTKSNKSSNDKLNVTLSNLKDVSPKTPFEKQKFNTPIKKTKQGTNMSKEKEKEIDVASSDNDDNESGSFDDDDDENVSFNDENESDSSDESDESDDENVQDVIHSKGKKRPHSDGSGDEDEIRKILKAKSISKATNAKHVQSPITSMKAKKRQRANSNECDEDKENESFLMPPADKRKKTHLEEPNFVALSSPNKDAKPSKKKASKNNKKSTPNQLTKTTKQKKAKLLKSIEITPSVNKKLTELPTNTDLLNEIHKRENDRDGRTLRISRLPKGCSVKTLQSVCKNNIFVFLKKKKVGLRYAFVTFATAKEAINCKTKLSGTKINGKVVNIKICAENISKLQKGGENAQSSSRRPLEGYKVKTLYVSCLPHTITPMDLAKVFPQASNINCPKFASETGATINFEQKETAIQSFYSCCGTLMNGKPIYINFMTKAHKPDDQKKTINNTKKQTKPSDDVKKVVSSVKGSKKNRSALKAQL